MDKAQKRALLFDAVAHASSAFTRETGLRLNPAHFELRAHPDDINDWITDAYNRYLMSEPRDVMGVQLVSDASVESGHPVLRSTWSMTL